MSTKDFKHKEKEEQNKNVQTDNSQSSQEEKSGEIKEVENAGCENAQAGCGCAQTSEQRMAELEAEKNDFQDKYLRKSADLENYRKRMVKEKQEIFDYANAGLLTDLIGILDDFDRALAAGCDTDGKPLADLKPVIDGVQIINRQMRSLLETKYDLTVYGEKGDLFDHDKHEAIATNKGAVAESVCSQVYLKGYMLKDRVIRHAKVMVTTPDGTENAESSDSAAEN